VLRGLPDRLTPADLWARVGVLEHERLDFGVSPAKDLQKTFAAMAMTDGGRVLLGIADDRSLVGCALDQRTLDTIKRAADAVEVDVQVRELLVDDRPLVEVLVPAVHDRIVTTSDGKLLRRVGSDSVPLRGGALGRFVRDRVGPAVEDVTVPLGPDALDLASLNQALKAAGRRDVRRAGAVRALQDLHVLPPDSRALTRAALLLFGERRAAAELGLRVQLVRRAGPHPSEGMTLERNEESGPLAHVADRVLTWIAGQTSAAEVVVSSKRERVQAFPPTAVREALLNALAHQDLGLTGATVDVVLWDDALQIRSPGGLPGHVTPENMRTEHFSRNPRVMRVLKILDLVEEFGEGMDRMYAAMEARLLPDPVVLAAEESVTVTLLSRSPLGLEDQVWLSMLAPLDLVPAERHALALVRRSGSLARKELHLVRPDVDAGSVLSGLVAKGLLVREGERGGTRYVLSEQVVARTGSGSVEERQRQRQGLEAHVRSLGSVTSQEAAAFLEEDVSTARALLQDLVRAGRLRRSGRTRGTRYHVISGA
jgi:ATP-dependent DNA helicase RecG